MAVLPTARCHEALRAAATSSWPRKAHRAPASRPRLSMLRSLHTMRSGQNRPNQHRRRKTHPWPDETQSAPRQSQIPSIMFALRPACAFPLQSPVTGRTAAEPAHRPKPKPFSLPPPSGGRRSKTHRACALPCYKERQQHREYAFMARTLQNLLRHGQRCCDGQKVGNFSFGFIVFSLVVHRLLSIDRAKSL